MPEVSTSFVNEFVYIYTLTMARLFTFFLLITVAASFMSPKPMRSTYTKRHMVDEQQPTAVVAPALQTVDETLPPRPEPPKNVVRELNSGEVREVKWVDPAMQANTKPYILSW